MRKADKAGAEKLARLAQEAQEIIRLSPADARGYSLLGNIRLAQGDADRALQLYRQALAVAPTERNALFHVLDHDLRSANRQAAMDHLDILLRRWPKTFPKVEAAILGFAHDRAGAALLVTRLRQHPPWRNKAISALVKDAQGRFLVQNLLLKEAASDAGANAYDISRLTRAFLKAHDVPSAYRTFLFTLPHAQRRYAEYVFDPQFALKPLNRPFGWQIAKAAYVETAYPWFGAGKHDKGGLSIQFRDAPVRLGNISQRLALPPGKFYLKTRVSARSLAAPKGLYWQLVCFGKGGERVRLSIPDGLYRERSLKAPFTIPQDCPSQLLVLRTGVRTPSWRARYQGEVIFHEVSIKKELSASAQ